MHIIKWIIPLGAMSVTVICWCWLFTFSKPFLNTQLIFAEKYIRTSLSSIDALTGQGLNKMTSIHDHYDPFKRTSWTTLSQVTDAKRTTARLMTPNTKLNLGDQIQVRLEARDSLGNIKTYGGDFFRIKLASDETRSYVNPDHVVDFDNGTYDFYFTLRWPGHSRIDAILVHSSEAISVLDRFIQHVPHRFAYDGRYTDPKTNREEITKCDIVVDPRKEYCNYSGSRHFAPWYCEKPKTPRMKCSEQPRLCNNIKRARQIINQNTTTLEREIFERRKIRTRDIALSVNVSDEIHPFQEPLQFCQLTKIPKDLSAQGYFLHDTWHPFNCKIKIFSVNEMRTCLKDTNIYMFGDSTMKQFAEFFETHIKGFQNVLKNRKRYSLSPRHVYNAAFNITVKFRSHGPPLTSQCQPLEEMHYVSNEINKVKGGPDVIILISLWAHFVRTSLDLYENRIEAILDSIEGLLERFPETTVIFKGGNTRHNEDIYWAISSSDWIVYRLEERLRSVLLRRNVNIGFLDAWDLTTAHYSPDSIHPNNHIVGTMINQLLTHHCICK